MQSIPVANFLIGPRQPLTVISGPCVIESEESALFAAETLKEMFTHLPFQLIYKSSYDKANRSARSSFRGPGLQEGLRILERVRDEWELPVVTDIHAPEEAAAAAEVCDMLQIPAFLCRQTDLLLAAAKTGKPINIKKGQFMAPWDMRGAIDKILCEGNEKILLTERGTSFGYNNLVTDFRAIAWMQQLGYPVCFDASHSVQLPGSLGHSSGGESVFIPLLSKAAIAAGCNALFIESHPEPERAKSDAASLLAFTSLRQLLEQIAPLYDLMQTPLLV